MTKVKSDGLATMAVSFQIDASWSMVYDTGNLEPNYSINRGINEMQDI